jgi:hypothetical protein
MCKGYKYVGSHQESVGVYFHFEYDNENKLQELVNKFVNFDAHVNLGKLVKIQAFLRHELDQYRNK